MQRQTSRPPGVNEGKPRAWSPKGGLRGYVRQGFSAEAEASCAWPANRPRIPRSECREAPASSSKLVTAPAGRQFSSGMWVLSADVPPAVPLVLLDAWGPDRRAVSVAS